MASKLEEERSVRNTSLIENILLHPIASEWKFTEHNLYTLLEVPKDTREYHMVEKLFDKTSRYLAIEKLQRVENPYLLGHYLLKKEKMRKTISGMTENYFFHGTDEENIDSICTFNFDWRLSGHSTGHKFGQGVSFSPEVYYASHYGKHVMFLIKVLVSNSVVGNKTMIIPPEPYDSSKNSNGTVYVKYEDDDFYPEYIKHYN